MPTLILKSLYRYQKPIIHVRTYNADIRVDKLIRVRVEINQIN